MAGASAAAALFTAYALTLAPGVTFWDAGEFIAAAHGFGIPHPPGTPLYVALARAWSAILPVRTAIATNLLSAALTAAAAGFVAVLVTRWLGRRAYGIAAAIAAGAMASVWASATETEVYAASLLLSLAMLAVGERAGRESRTPAVVLLGFLFALSPAVHLSALVAAPAAIVLAMRAEPDGTRWWHGAALLAALVMAAGMGTVNWWLVATGAGGLLLVAILQRTRLAAREVVRAPALALLGASVLAATALIILLVRAQHDPVLNQGDPSTVSAMLDVIGRRQYAVPGLWPRRAPLWLQVANLFEYVDWQVALGLAPGVTPSVARTPFTILFVALGLAGSLRHRELHRRSWLATLVLLACASVGVVVYLNLRAGPSFGYGILPDGAPREPRERDYFFALGFFTWGLWAGIGAVAASLRVMRGRAWPGVVLAALPIALNWRAADRGRMPEAAVPRALAAELLAAVPQSAVLFVWGDNDTYPIWYLQQVEGVRTDVTVVTVPLLSADWYREELRRRHALVDAQELGRWRGESEEVAAVAELAADAGRPVAAAVTIPGSYRRRIADVWVLTGLAHVAVEGGVGGSSGAAADSGPGEGLRVDAGKAGPAAARVASLLAAPRPRDVIDPTPWSMRELLRCPGYAMAVAEGRGGEGAGSLDLICNRR